MLVRLRIENFRGFRSFDARIDRVTAFLGPNSSGKTTVLHAVRLACEAVNLALLEDSPARVRAEGGIEWVELVDGLLLDASRLLPLSDWRALFVDHNVGEGVKFQIRLNFYAADPVQEIEVDVVCARNEQLKLTVWVRADEASSNVRELPKKSQHISQRLRDFVREHAPVTVLVPPFYGTVREEEFRSRAIIDRLLGSGDQSHVVRNLVVGLDAGQFDQLNAFLDSTIGARLTRRTSQTEVQDVTHLAVHFRDTNGELELSAAGAGLINLIALFSALARWRQESARRRVLFLLDEPEAHLHPRLQAESAARLAQLITREFDAQLLLATHSVDILNRLSQSGGLLLRCDRSNTPSAVLLESDASLFDDLGSWVDLTPYTAINSLASRRVLFCEGADEVRLLPKLGQLRYRNAPAQLSSFRRWAIIELGGAS
ncbi:MAG: ATP-dependent nuclease, partial [Verrucomicrobiota bacterium]